MNRNSARSLLCPVQDVIDVDEAAISTVDVTPDEHDVTPCLAHSDGMSGTPSSSPNDEDVFDADFLNLVAKNWMKDSNGLKKATCWIFLCPRQVLLSENPT